MWKQKVKLGVFSIVKFVEITITMVDMNINDIQFVINVDMLGMAS